MPLDPTKHHSDRRRLAHDPIAAVRQDGMYSREIEMKRNRGEISCAECRRCVIKPAPLPFTLIFSYFLCQLDLRSSATSKFLVNLVRYVPPNDSPFSPPLTLPTKRRGCASLCPNGPSSLPSSGSVLLTALLDD